MTAFGDASEDGRRGSPAAAGTAAEAGDPVDVWFQGDGIRIHGLDWRGPATGRLMLLLHGFGGNARIWDDLMRLLRAALPHHRFVGLDGRDGGDTDHPATGYERERFIADILAAHDSLGGEPMVVVAHSRAGWLAAWLAARHPDRVAALVLVDPARLAFPGQAEEDKTYTAVREALGPFESEADALAWARGSDPEARWTATRTRSFLETLRRRPDGRLEGKLPIGAIEQLRQARGAGGEVVDAVSSITAPTLLLIADRQTEIRITAKLDYADRIPGTKVVRLDGSHYLQTDTPAEVAAAMIEFLGPPRELRSRG